MKRRRLIVAGGLAFSLASPWLFLPCPRATFYELAFHLGPIPKRGWCLEKLEALGPDGAPSLVSLLEGEGGSEDDQARRWQALKALFRGVPANLPAIADGLRDSKVTVRRRAAFILACAAWDAHQDLPISVLDFDLPDEVRPPELTTPPKPYIKKYRGRFEPLIPALLRGVKDEDPTVRASCYYVLAGLPETAAEALYPALEDICGSDGILVNNARVVVQIAGRAAVPGLRRRLAVFLDELESRPAKTGEGYEAEPLADATGFALAALAKHDMVGEDDLVRAFKHPQLRLHAGLAAALAGREDAEAVMKKAGLSEDELELLRMMIEEETLMQKELARLRGG